MNEKEFEVGDLVRVVEYDTRKLEAMEEVLSEATGVSTSVKSPASYGVVIEKRNPQWHKPYHVLLEGKLQRKKWFFAAHMRLIS